MADVVASFERNAQAVTDRMAKLDEQGWTKQGQFLMEVAPFFFQAEDGIRDGTVTGVQTCALPISGARQIAREVALDHLLTWQIRHVAAEPSTVARLAAAYLDGESWPAGFQPVVRVADETRKVDSAVRSRLLNMRYLAPARYRELSAAVVLPLSEADRLLLRGSAEAAVQAYRDLIAGSADPQPDAWIGLALALHRLPPSRLQAAFATRLALMFDVHTRLGRRTDPLDLASWFG